MSRLFGAEGALALTCSGGLAVCLEDGLYKCRAKFLASMDRQMWSYYRGTLLNWRVCESGSRRGHINGNIAVNAFDIAEDFFANRFLRQV